MQDGVNRLSNIAVDGLEVWQKYLTFGSSVAYYWGDNQSDDLKRAEQQACCLIPDEPINLRRTNGRLSSSCADVIALVSRIQKRRREPAGQASSRRRLGRIRRFEGAAAGGGNCKELAVCKAMTT